MCGLNCARLSDRIRVFTGTSPSLLPIMKAPRLALNVCKLSPPGNRVNSCLSGEFQLVVDHPLPHQYLRLRIELGQGLTAEQVPDLSQQIRQLLSQQLNFRAEAVAFREKRPAVFTGR